MIKIQIHVHRRRGNPETVFTGQVSQLPVIGHFIGLKNPVRIYKVVRICHDVQADSIDIIVTQEKDPR